MDANNKEKHKRDAGQTQIESTFTESSTEREQNFSNEQEANPDEKPYKRVTNERTGNLSDQYHSATKTGEIQNKNNEATEKAAQQGDDYYDQGPHQPSLAEEELEEKQKKSKKD